LRALLAAAAAAGERGAAMAVAELDDPGSLGRVLARPDGSLDRIVEARDASADQLAVRTVNAGIYALPAPEVFARLARLDAHNAQGELYLTDAVTALAAEPPGVALLRLADPDEGLGVNTRAELAAVHHRLVERKLHPLIPRDAPAGALAVGLDKTTKD
jgi:bifunctional UDP-N-acetylglucosamine pyrophosphorylase/glucosamine-1-phosphate N-acetyltransferase